MTRDAEVAIVGAGLSGLALAQALKTEGRDLLLLEARERVGGRILSPAGHDLGPAWIWPHNRRMLALVAELGLATFAQHSAGRLVFEERHGAIRRDLDMATMGGALRVAGGLAQITDALAHGLGDTVRLGQPVTQVTETEAGVALQAGGRTLRAGRVVLALPPRLAAGLGLGLPDVPTWMAGQAKFVAVYDRPFWRDDGLSGDAISHRGPLAEIHDASPAEGGAGALFGFAHPGAVRHAAFEVHAKEQLARLFGPHALRPQTVFIKDWSADPATATEADLAPLTEHPRYGPLPTSCRILLAGTEVAPSEGGFLEGALEAADAAHRQLSEVVA